MSVSQFSISISNELTQYIETYQAKNNMLSRSEVIEHALKLLKEKELENAYYEAGQEWLHSEDSALWEGI